MRLIYIDDSHDQQIHVFSALVIPEESWHRTFQAVREYRRRLKNEFGIYVHKELHAWKFVSGRGRPSSRIATKWERAEIFKGLLELVSTLPDVYLFNTVFPHRQDERALERLLNRLNRSLLSWNTRGLLILDQGKDAQYTRLVRKMCVYNPIPSMYGQWHGTGTSWQNIPLARIVEDPIFKDSQKSYFIQLVDFCAWALLRRENPVPSKTRYGLDRAFNILDPILFRAASRKDPEGIIRP